MNNFLKIFLVVVVLLFISSFLFRFLLKIGIIALVVLGIIYLARKVFE